MKCRSKAAHCYHSLRHLRSVDSSQNGGSHFPLPRIITLCSSVILHFSRYNSKLKSFLSKWINGKMYGTVYKRKWRRKGSDRTLEERARARNLVLLRMSWSCNVWLQSQTTNKQHSLTSPVLRDPPYPSHHRPHYEEQPIYVVPEVFSAWLDIQGTALDLPFPLVQLSWHFRCWFHNEYTWCRKNSISY